jgi:dynein heavy chain 1
MVPTEWRKYPIPSYVSINIWVADFGERLKQLQDIRKTKDFGRSSIWLGGLFSAEAYITATRQAAAQANAWSLENLEIVAEIVDDPKSVTASESSFIARGLTLDGAAWKNNQLTLTTDIGTSLPAVKYTWRLRDTQATAGDKVNIPVYLNDTRADYLFAVDLKIPNDYSKNMWYQRCISITTWSN